MHKPQATRLMPPASYSKMKYYLESLFFLIAIEASFSKEFLTGTSARTFEIKWDHLEHSAALITILILNNIKQFDLF